MPLATRDRVISGSVCACVADDRLEGPLMRRWSVDKRGRDHGLRNPGRWRGLHQGAKARPRSLPASSLPNTGSGRRSDFRGPSPRRARSVGDDPAGFPCLRLCRVGSGPGPDSLHPTGLSPGEGSCSRELDLGCRASDRGHGNEPALRAFPPAARRRAIAVPCGLTVNWGFALGRQDTLHPEATV